MTTERNPSGLRVLLVEDDVEINTVLSTLFVEEGHVCESARSVEGARRVLDSHAFDVILLDWMLGQETAEELLPRLAAMSPVPAVVLYSASPDAQRVADKWSIVFVAKPFDVDMLCTTIRDAVLRKSLPTLARLTAESEAAPTRDSVEEAAQAEDSNAMAAGAAEEPEPVGDPDPSDDGSGTPLS